MHSSQSQSNHLQKVKRIGARLGFLASSVFAFTIGWWAVSFVLLTCALLGYYRTCAIVRNIWCGILPYSAWTTEKPSDYKSYNQFLKLRLKASIRFLLFRETSSDISLQDSFQVSFADFFRTQENEAKAEESVNGEDDYSYLYGSWKEGNPNAWKE